ncbi:hypothetical protein GCM10020358_65480 [Amorphoplanes nipponensis]|uniref:NodB homology domain-containing protein n=2 Tax=Actinoplanes nipponensis TaxID=135950 RepID=A0A919JM25_9ACTN|nr:hypothetical protein Ani05nite_51950 [Actinoplanes nipponensis]
MFSIIVPTFDRRDVVLGSIQSIAAAERPWPCELIVVVDGSTDGTYEALCDLELSIPLVRLRQGNTGAAAARNCGARAARGRYLLFLDDDMCIDRRLLIEHERLLADGADAVVGDIPLHPDSPVTLLTRGVARWTEQRRRRLARHGGRLGVADFLTGQLSVRASCFAAVHGFDESLTAGGSFGGEDTDFFFRLLQSRTRVAYAAGAISHQRYVVSPAQNIAQWWQAGCADARLSRKHRAIGSGLWDQHRGDTVTGRLVRLAATGPPAVRRRVQSAVVRRVEDGHMDRPTEWLFARTRDVAYWAGVRAGGGITRHRGTDLRILAYHAVLDIDDPVVGPYAVHPQRFEEQIIRLLADGHTFIDAGQLLSFLDGCGALPERSIMLTFDDGYESLLQHAAPLLARLAIPAVVCVVTGQLGGHNAWDESRGATRQSLLNGAQLRALSRDGWEIAAHSHTHAHLRSADGRQLTGELARPRADLAALGLPPPRLIAYPYGEHDFRVRHGVRQAGYSAALALTGRVPTPSAANRFALPRIEVGQEMSVSRLRELLERPESRWECRPGPMVRAATRFGPGRLIAPWRRPARNPPAPALTSSTDQIRNG